MIWPLTRLDLGLIEHVDLLVGDEALKQGSARPDGGLDPKSSSVPLPHCNTLDQLIMDTG